MSHQKDEDMLNQYPDLSDEEDNQGEEPPKNLNLPNSQPHKIIKPNQPSQSTTNKPVFTAPLLFGGKSFIPPPPPPSKGKGNHYSSSPPPPPVNLSHQKVNSNVSSNSQKPHEQIARPERQRKNCIFVKNIPKHYNEMDKLMTFFKNEGQIREIKVNHEESSAVVRFSKEEDSIKFSQSKKAIFNRSFITYSLNQKDIVPLDYVQQRQNQESGKVKKPLQVEMRQSRERLDAVLADKIRALLFLVKNVTQENQLSLLKLQLQMVIDQKKMLQKYGFQEIANANKTIINDYDWTLTYTLSKNMQNSKKGLVFDLQKKYGPVSLIQFTPVGKPNDNKSTDPLEEKGPEIVKIIFLGIKSSWEYYYLNKLNKVEPLEEQNDLQVQGIKLRALFNEGIINKPMIPIITSTPSNRQDLKDQLVEVLENGEVQPIKEQQRVIEPQVDQLQVGHPNIQDQAVKGETIRKQE